ncbi:MAG: carboxypeptidase-like regulatory domain-containing protein, partial [Niabella sp.]
MKQKIYFLLFVSLLLSMSQSLWAQTTITGTVVNQENEPIIGASVTIEGQSIGTTTDENGNFSLRMPDKNTTLVVSYIGYVSYSATWDGSTKLTIQLQPTDSNIQEVIVVGYGKQKKASVTGAVAQVSGKDLTAAPVANV